jgi:hypothetical protein
LFTAGVEPDSKENLDCGQGASPVPCPRSGTRTTIPCLVAKIPAFLAVSRLEGIGPALNLVVIHVFDMAGDIPAVSGRVGYASVTVSVKHVGGGRVRGA